VFANIDAAAKTPFLAAAAFVLVNSVSDFSRL